MGEILREQGFQQTGCTDISCAVKTGKILSANKILVGTAMQLGSKIIISGRIVDVEKGVAEFGEKAQANNRDEILDAVTLFTDRLSARILDTPLPDGRMRSVGKRNYNIAIECGKVFSDGYSASLLFSNSVDSFFHWGLSLLYVKIEDIEGEDEWIGEYSAKGLGAEVGVNYKLSDRIAIQPYASIMWHKASYTECEGGGALYGYYWEEGEEGSAFR